MQRRSRYGAPSSISERRKRATRLSRSPIMTSRMTSWWVQFRILLRSSDRSSASSSSVPCATSPSWSPTACSSASRARISEITANSNPGTMTSTTENICSFARREPRENLSILSCRPRPRSIGCGVSSVFRPMRVRTGKTARAGGALLVAAVVLIRASSAPPADHPPSPPTSEAQASLLSLPTPIGAVRYTPGHGLRVGDTGLTLAGYGAVDLLHEEGGATTFRAENVDLFVIWDPLARVHLFSEIDMVDQENPHEQRRTFLTDRLFGDFAGFDWLNPRAGKFLTPTGRWHQIHARPLVWPTPRPPRPTPPLDPNLT